MNDENHTIKYWLRFLKRMSEVSSYEREQVRRMLLGYADALAVMNGKRDYTRVMVAREPLKSIVPTTKRGAR